jgi:3-hydroxyacyl-[acyl-carrier-protein] dehydratase
MHFNLIDRVLEVSESHIVTLKHVSSAEEYLQDHFPSFPVLPGVMMLEAMTQASRQFLDPQNQSELPWVLTQARALKYGSFVRPGASIRVTMTKHKDNDDGSVDFKGDVRLIEPNTDSVGISDNLPVACSGRITMRPVTTGTHQ